MTPASAEAAQVPLEHRPAPLDHVGARARAPILESEAVVDAKMPEAVARELVGSQAVRVDGCAGLDAAAHEIRERAFVHALDSRHAHAAHARRGIALRRARDGEFSRKRTAAPRSLAPADVPAQIAFVDGDFPDERRERSPRKRDAAAKNAEKARRRVPVDAGHARRAAGCAARAEQAQEKFLSSRADAGTRYFLHIRKKRPRRPRRKIFFSLPREIPPARKIFFALARKSCAASFHRAKFAPVSPPRSPLLAAYLCQCLLKDIPELSKYANLWRTSGDITDLWISLSRISRDLPNWFPFTRSGKYSDPDMLQVGNLGKPNTPSETFRPTGFSREEQYFQVSLWVIAAAPLILSCDVSSLDDFTKGLLTNTEVLAVHQSYPVFPPRLREQTLATHIITRETENGTAVCVLNYSALKKKVTVPFREWGIGTQVSSGDSPKTATVRDLWRQRDLPADRITDDGFTVEIAGHSGELFLIR